MKSYVILRQRTVLPSLLGQVTISVDGQGFVILAVRAGDEEALWTLSLKRGALPGDRSIERLSGAAFVTSIFGEPSALSRSVSL